MDINIKDTDSFESIKGQLNDFQKALINDFKSIGESVVNEEFAYIKETIQNKHGKKYNVIMEKTDTGWIIFPDNADQAVLEEFGLNFPIWRKLYAEYKASEPK